MYSAMIILCMRNDDSVDRRFHLRRTKSMALVFQGNKLYSISDDVILYGDRNIITSLLGLMVVIQYSYASIVFSEFGSSTWHPIYRIRGFAHCYVVTILCTEVPVNG